MKGIRAKKINIALVMFCVVFLAALVLAGGCSKKEKTEEQRTPEAAQKAETEKKGAPAPGIVKLTPEGVKAAGIEVQTVAATTPSGVISATAVLEMNGDRVARVNPRAAGRAVSVNASQGDRVRHGQVLAQIDSVDMDQAWSNYLKAKGRLDLAARSARREETLFQKKVSPEKDLFKSRQEYSEAEADLLLAKERFRLLGVDVQHLETDTNGTDQKRPLIPVCAPLSGVIIEKTVAKGEMIGPEKTLFTVADLSTLWLIVDIYEHNLGRIKTGMQVKLSISAYPGKEFRGKISYMGDVMDDKTRTVKARVSIENRDGFLKPGMFATATIDSVKDSRAEKVIVVPEEAVFLDGSERYVFVHEGDGRFVVRRVSVGPASGLKIEIKEGLKVGEAVVTKGVFTLKSELKKDTLQGE
jgi:cobalt-zinc-cadmium efflux system membrane fusion protein